MTTKIKLGLAAFVILLTAFICYRILIADHSQQQTASTSRIHPDDPCMTKPIDTTQQINTPTTNTQPLPDIHNQSSVQTLPASPQISMPTNDQPATINEVPRTAIGGVVMLTEADANMPTVIPDPSTLLQSRTSADTSHNDNIVTLTSTPAVLVIASPPTAASATSKPPVATVHSASSTAAALPDTYTVKKGDSLWSIATQLYQDGKKYTLIQKANPYINPNNIRPGQILTIPRTPQPSTTNTTPAHAKPKHIIVQQNQTLSTIAHTYYGDAAKWPIIFKANQHTINDPNNIKPGQPLIIPPLIPENSLTSP